MGFRIALTLLLVCLKLVIDLRFGGLGVWEFGTGESGFVIVLFASQFKDLS
jgi:hypothetical protein